jgi:holliday junction DNA helicase RuvA
MLESLTGKVTGRSGTTLFFSTGPMEWAMEATAAAVISFSAAEDEVTVPVHLIHREDAMQLFAFVSKKERSLFRELLKVSGIGPKQASRILSGIEADRFIAALESEDIDTLATIPGIGKKSAGKIILALRGKLTPAEPDEGDNRGDGAGTFMSRTMPELLEALVGMGFDRRTAEQALKAAGAELELESETLDPGELERNLFRAAIVRLSS